MTVKTEHIVVPILCIFTHLATADDLPVAADMAGGFSIAYSDMRELPDTAEAYVSSRPSLGKNKTSRGRIVMSLSIVSVPHMDSWEDDTPPFEDNEEELYSPYFDFEIIMPQEPVSTLIEVSGSKLTDMQSYISFL